MYSSDRKNSQQKTKARKLQNLSVIQVAQNMKELIDNNVEHHVNLDIALPFFKDKNNGYSFMNSFWTLLPKFCASSPQVDKLEFPWIQVGNDSYQVTLIPTVRKNNANSKTSDWPLKAVFPNLREMYVEEALTKFAVCDFRHGLGACEIELEDLSKQYLVSVKFTLYDLQKELRERGHSYNINEIKDSLKILNEVVMCVKLKTKHPDDPRKEFFFEHRGTIISQLQFTGKSSSLNAGKTMNRVVFHQLKTISIMNIAFRAYNYDKSMGLSNLLSKYIYNRMIANWKQADKSKPYSFKLNNFNKLIAREPTKRIYDDTTTLKRALDELKKHKIINNVKLEPIFEHTTNDKRKRSDMYVHLTAHQEFINDTFVANKIQKTRQIELQNKKNTEIQLPSVEESQEIVRQILLRAKYK